MQLEIILPSGETHFSPGETAQIGWSWEAEKEINSLELRLVWNTVGKGDQDLQIVQTWQTPQAGRKGTHRTEITFPHAPYSFSGKFISLIWAFELIALPQGETKRVEIIIAPQGLEVLLPAVVQM